MIAFKIKTKVNKLIILNLELSNNKLIKKINNYN